MSCHVCGGASRFTIIAIYNPRPFFERWDRSGIAHCRDHPEHDTGEPYLRAILAHRTAVGAAAWAGDDDWSDAQKRRRGDWPPAAQPPERSEA